jgi:hypothetical protein
LSLRLGGGEAGWQEVTRLRVGFQFRVPLANSRRHTMERSLSRSTNVIEEAKNEILNHILDDFYSDSIGITAISDW